MEDWALLPCFKHAAKASAVGALGVFFLGLLALAGPGIRQTVTLSPEGFSSLELALSWLGDPVTTSLTGLWDEAGLSRGEIGASLGLGELGLSASVGVETAGGWDVSLGGNFSQPPLTVAGMVSFDTVGFTNWSLNALLEGDVFSLEASAIWEGELRGGLAARLAAESLSLEAGVSLSARGLETVLGKASFGEEEREAVFGVSYGVLRHELFLSTELNIRSEHLTVGFSAIWDLSPREELSPAAAVQEERSGQGAVRFLRELRLETSMAVPPDEEVGRTAGKGPSAFISAPRGSTFVVGEEIQFSARGSSFLAPIGKYQWSFGDGCTARGTKVAHRYDSPGLYRVVLVVTDGAGNSARTERVLRVLAPELYADFDWKPARPTIMDEVRFYDLSRGEIATWHWDFGDGTTSNASQPTHRYQAKGTFTVTLTVYDRYGNSASTSKELQVVNTPPTADPGGPYEGFIYQEIVFNGRGSTDPDGEIVSYLWDFGDGTRGQGPQVVHVYRKPGTYTVCLTVVDDDGTEATACTTAEIAIPYQTPGSEGL